MAFCIGFCCHLLNFFLCSVLVSAGAGTGWAFHFTKKPVPDPVIIGSAVSIYEFFFQNVYPSVFCQNLAGLVTRAFNCISVPKKRGIYLVSPIGFRVPWIFFNVLPFTCLFADGIWLLRLTTWCASWWPPSWLAALGCYGSQLVAPAGDLHLWDILLY
jgi:hypothetical protein